MGTTLTSHHKITTFLSMVVLLLMMGGCGHPADNEQLVAVDTLLAQNRGEEAMQMLQMLNTASFNNHDKAYQALLTVQANHACNIAATDDNAINEAVKPLTPKKKEKLTMLEKMKQQGRLPEVPKGAVEEEPENDD